MSSDLAAPAVLERAAKVRLAVFDVDGVMTDGLVTYSDDGRELKSFCTQDGLGIKLLQRVGITVAVITGRESPIVAHRMAELGVDHVYQGREEKRGTFDSLIKALQLDAEQSAYIGDDLQDLPLMRRAGLAATVPNAHPRVREFAHWVSPRRGGAGAARDFCDLLLDAQGHLDSLIADYR